MQDALVSKPRDANEVRACEGIRKMHGGAQSHLVRTDGGLYVCKWRGNPQHRRILINEALGTQLLMLMRIATPDWAIVNVDNVFLESNPSVNISLQSTSKPITRGPHFGSRVMVNPESTAIYDSLSSHLFDRVVNLNDFVKVFVFDLWVDNFDTRQAIFFRAGGSHRRAMRFKAQMIDNGFAFGFDGLDWRLRDRPVAKVYPGLEDLYLGISAAEPIGEAIASAQAVSEGDCNQMIKLLPQDWLEDDHRAIHTMFGELLRRANRLPDLVALALENLRKRRSDRRRPESTRASAQTIKTVELYPGEVTQRSHVNMPRSMLTIKRAALSCLVLLTVTRCATAQVESAVAALGKGVTSATGEIARGAAQVAGHLVVSVPVGTGVALVRGTSVAVFATGYFLLEGGLAIAGSTGTTLIRTGAYVAKDLTLGVGKAAWCVLRPRRTKERKPLEAQ